MNKKTLVFALLLSALPFQAAAKDSVVAACTFKDGKKLLVKRDGKYYRYHFGNPKRWELVFANTRAQVAAQTERWKGTGRYMWRSINLKNDQYGYDIRTALDRVSDDHDVTLTLTVSRHGETLSTRECDLSRPHTINFPGDIE